MKIQCKISLTSKIMKKHRNLECFSKLPIAMIVCCASEFPCKVTVVPHNCYIIFLDIIS